MTVATALRRTGASAALSTPTLLNASSPGGTVASVTSGSITPSTNALLVVLARCAGDESASIAVTSTTLSNVGSWTNLRVYSGSAAVGTLLVAYAKVTGSAGTGTVTASWAAGHSRPAIQVVEITGYNTTTPVAQSKIGTPTNGSTSESFGSTPAATSTVIGGLVTTQIAAPTAGSGFTLIQNTLATDAYVSSEYQAGNATTVNWTYDATQPGVSIGIEVAAA